MDRLEIGQLRSTFEGWLSEARRQTYDVAYDLTDLEWLGGRISALNDVIALIDGHQPPELALRARLLGHDAAEIAALRAGLRAQAVSGTAEDQTRSKLSM